MESSQFSYGGPGSSYEGQTDRPQEGPGKTPLRTLSGAGSLLVRSSPGRRPPRPQAPAPCPSPRRRRGAPLPPPLSGAPPSRLSDGIALPVAGLLRVFRSLRRLWPTGIRTRRSSIRQPPPRRQVVRHTLTRRNWLAVVIATAVLAAAHRSGCRARWSGSTPTDRWSRSSSPTRACWPSPRTSRRYWPRSNRRWCPSTATPSRSSRRRLRRGGGHGHDPHPAGRGADQQPCGRWGRRR